MLHGRQLVAVVLGGFADTGLHKLGVEICEIAVGVHQEKATYGSAS